MRMKALLVEAFNALRYYRRRTLVTILSLGWGVACFVVLMSYGNGFGTLMEQSFHALGQDVVAMFNGQTSLQAGGIRAGHNVRMKLSDIEALREAVPAVGGISPEMFMGNRPIVRGTREREFDIRGVGLEYRSIRNMNLRSGRWFTPEDLFQRNRVAVLGSTVASKVFSLIPPEGETITIAGVRFSVIGVLEPKGQLSNYARPDNDSVFIPYETAAVFRNIQYPDAIIWSPVSPLVRPRAVKQVKETLATLHNFSPADPRAVEIVVFNDFMYIIDGMTIALGILVGFIGTLTLAIGGVGLANIMLASVVERTREIGVLKALGGRARLIRMQFLIEGLIIVVAGGFLGTLFGIGLTAFIGTIPLLGPLFEDAASTGDLHLRISAGSVLLSTGVLILVGLVAGMAPAIKASRMDPIEALRYE